MFRLFTPLTPLATLSSAFPRIDGGSTSVGPLGLLLMDVKSPQAVMVARAAETLRVLYRISLSSKAGTAARALWSQSCARAAAGRFPHPSQCRGPKAVSDPSV